MQEDASQIVVCKVAAIFRPLGKLQFLISRMWDKLEVNKNTSFDLWHFIIPWYHKSSW